MLKHLALILLLLSGTAFGDSKSDVKESGRWYTQSQVDTGQSLYQKHCAECHGEYAQGTFNWKSTLPDGSYPPPPLNGTAHTWHHPLSVLKRTIKNGGIPLGGKMPAFKNTLSEQEQEAVIAFFQSKWRDEIYKAWIQRGGLN